MRRSVTQRLAVGLLALGGVVFAVLGVRMLLHDRVETARRAAWPTRAAVLRAKADAMRLAGTPRGRPLAEWRLEPLQIPASPGTLPDDLIPRLQRAAGMERDPEQAIALYDALLHPQVKVWARHVAQLRKAELLRELGRGVEATPLLHEALDASPFVVDTTGRRVRSHALALLAADGLGRGDLAPLRDLLEEAEDGVRLVKGGLGPSDELLELSARVAAGDLPQPPGAIGRRLRRASQHAREGREVQSMLRKDGFALRGDQLAWRAGDKLALFPLDALLEPPPSGYAQAVGIERVASGAALPDGAVRLDSPLGELVARPLPPPDEGGLVWLALALGSGMLLYVLGSGIALAGWRRSRRAARQQADFTAAVSHEMKTPIASVRAMAELLEEVGEEEPGLSRRYAGRIGMEMDRLGATVRNVLDAARIEQGTMPVHPEPGDPADVALRVADVVGAGLEARGFSLVVDVVPATGRVPVDAAALEGVLMNLLDNAVKFSLDRRELALRGAPAPGGGYRLAVLDRGIGLDPGDPERLFGRYERGEAARRGAVPGVGLGLFIARQVVEAHGGRLRARVRADGGSAFEIDLPGAEIP